MNVRGRFISFEGGEACGKSTQVRLLAEALQRRGLTVRTLREPGGTPLGEKLRHLLKHDPDGRGMAAETELLLMNASRAELVRQIIRPALMAGEIVLCDRFSDSTVAYQAFGRGLPLPAVQSVIDFAVGETRPDLTLLLTLSRAVAHRRLAGRNAGSEPVADRFEAEADPFFGRVAEGYRHLLDREPERVRRIDAEGSVESVFAQVWEAVTPLLPPVAG